MAEPWVSIDDVAVHLGVGKMSIYRWIEKRGLPATKIGKLWKLKLSEVDAWMREGRHAAASVGERPRSEGATQRVVLVVDDDVLVRASVTDFLEDEGYRVLVAGEGAEALKMLVGPPRPDLILLDLRMPSLDGRQFREEQLRDPGLSAVPVIVITAASTASLEGVTAVLCKPLRLPVLAKTIESLLTDSHSSVEKGGHGV